ncbi:LOW QUALITY PROTEIN: Retroelement [Phytophthora megakarya]|uniref:Retroelement n=1 Tax=Phytophthora megakarya TaxID=4795 RepID=A0A225WMV8_9STRA|nr:LOW QUALITY PROTEIN: Retroelement [Phytophthora megakarya]
MEFELNLKADARPSSRAPFRLSKTEQEALQVFVDDLLEKQWIEISDSLWVSNVFGIPKRDRKTGKQQSRREWIRSGNPTAPVRWVVDYRYLNSQTLVPKIPLPNIEELFDQMARAVVFSVIDLAQGYQQMRVKPACRPYTAFRTGTETYHWCVAPMGMAGMPGIWSRLMRLLLGKFEFVVVYLDAICIYSASLAEHEQHLRTVFEVLRVEKLFARLEKCVFAQSSVNFLGHTISSKGLQVDQTKTSSIEQWKVPTTVKELQSFLGLAGYYRRFIHRDLVKKDKPWQWTAYQENAFLVIKTALQQAPILRLTNFDEEFVVTTDASKHCCGAVLSQRHDGFDHPVAFLSKKPGKHELFAIELALAKWRHYLHGRHFLVYTDNSSCHWFLHHSNVSAKLLHHVKGVQNIVADALSRHVQDEDGTHEQPEEAITPDDVGSISSRSDQDLHVSVGNIHSCSDTCRRAQQLIADRHRLMNELAARSSYDLHLLLDDQQRRVDTGRARPVIDQQRLALSVNSSTRYATTAALSKDMRSLFGASYIRDNEFTDVLTDEPHAMNEGVYYRKDGLVYRQTGDVVDTICVPNDYELRTKVLAEFHDGAAHPGVPRTLAKMSQWYYWKEMKVDVNDYVQSCLTCNKLKVSKCWKHVGVDYVTGVPTSNGFDCIQVAVDLLSQRAKYAPMNSTATAADCTRVFFDSVVRHHGLPQEIVSDRDPRFTAAFWQELMKIMGVKLRMTTAHRAQADGQVERQNRVLEYSLRCMTSIHGSEWADLLGTIEFAHATLVSTSTGLTPFEIDCGRVARHPGSSDASSAVPRLVHTKAEFAKQFAEHRRKVVEQAQQALLDAKQKQEQYYDKRRAEVDFKSGDRVLLKTENLSFRLVSHNFELTKAKLSARFVGPFPIEYMVNENVARLKLPKRFKRMHPSFNVDLLVACPEQHERFRSRPKYKETPVELSDLAEGDDMRIVEKLLAKRQFNRKTEYLVQWLGEPPSESTWELEKNLKHVIQWRCLVKELRDHNAPSAQYRGEILLATDANPRSHTGKLQPVRHTRKTQEELNNSNLQQQRLSVREHGVVP